MKKNCWQFKGCGRQADCDGEEVMCPAQLMTIYDGINGGKNGGRVCWMIAGTTCDGRTQSSFAQKVKCCSECDFYKAVAVEEGDQLQQPLTIIEDIISRLR